MGVVDDLLVISLNLGNGVVMVGLQVLVAEGERLERYGAVRVVGGSIDHLSPFVGQGEGEHVGLEFPVLGRPVEALVGLQDDVGRDRLVDQRVISKVDDLAGFGDVHLPLPCRIGLEAARSLLLAQLVASVRQTVVRGCRDAL